MSSNLSCKTGVEGIAYYVHRKSPSRQPRPWATCTSHGWIHRDVKPDNFLMNRQGKRKTDRFRPGRTPQRASWENCSAAAGKFRARAATCRPSKFAARGSTSDPTFTAWPACCTNWSPASRRLPAPTTQELLTKHLRTAPPSLEASGRDVTTGICRIDSTNALEGTRQAAAEHERRAADPARNESVQPNADRTDLENERLWRNQFEVRTGRSSKHAIDQRNCKRD